MLAQARRRLSQRAAQVQFRQADLLELDVQTLGIDSGVDGILSTSTFHWVTDHERLFASLAGVLRPGGQLVAQCGGEGNLERLLAAVRSLGMERRGMWLYASVEDTASRLRDAGFADVQVWSNPEPTPFVDQTALAEFLEAVCLRDHLAGIPRHARRAFVARVVAQMPEPVLDYVRLNIVARRSMGRHAR
jgi:trans-aconitate 2-methyltransferase